MTPPKKAVVKRYEIQGGHQETTVIYLANGKYFKSNNLGEFGATTAFLGTAYFLDYFGLGFTSFVNVLILVY